MHCSSYVYEHPPECLFRRTEHQNNREYTVSRDRSHFFVNNNPGNQLTIYNVLGHKEN
jgi:hypothetical protein